MYRHLTIVCSLCILILGLLTLTFSTHAKRNFQPMQSSAPINVALATNGAVASASSAYVNGNFPVAAVNNGDRKGMNWGSGGGWNDNTHGEYSSDVVQITFPAFNFVSQINVFTLRDNFQDNQTPPTLTETFSTCENSGYGITEFEVQYWNGSMWVTVPGGLVRNNNKVWRQLTFPEVWASAVRVQVHGSVRFTTFPINYSRIIEIEAYGRTAGFNLAAAANGALAIASSQINANFPVSAVNDGDRTGFNWNRGGFGSGWNDATENEYSIDWVRIDFAGGQTRRINEIDVYTLRDGFSTKTDDPTIFETFVAAEDGGGGITDYDVQYLSGGGWRNIPGGKVTDNNKVRRQFRFSPITTSAIRVAVHKGAYYTTAPIDFSRIIEIEAWENAAVQDDVVWVEDTIPAGATAASDFESWSWTCFNPLPLAGTQAHPSGLVAGIHQHYFLNATQTLTVNAGDTLVAHVYLDPANPPTAVMLQWNDGTWEHRAYWGANQFPWGVDGTVSRRNMGALPPTGQWVRLEVPASLVGLEGRTLNGMAFSLFNGRAVWDHAGKYAGGAPVVQPTISISDVTMNEGNSGTTAATFNVTLSSASTQTISVNYATANGTASSPSDYVSAGGSVTFAPGQTSQSLPIQVVGDTALEANENFFVNLTNPVNATLADSQGVGTILNDDTLPAISINNATVMEGTVGSGTVLAVFNVTLSGSSTQTVSVNYATANGTASSPSDYIAASGTITFAPGQTSRQFTIEIVGDTANESSETYFVNLTNPVNATLANNQGIGTILNDDAQPTISISDVSVNEGNSGTRAAVFNVTLSSASGQTISVDYATANGTASSPSDYVSGSGAITFTPGQTGQTITIQVVGETVLEANENFSVNLSNPVNATLADGQGVGTILNDDAPPTISISDASVNEGNSGLTSVVFNVTLSSASGQTISVNYTTANGSACSPSDYVEASGTITFAVGQTSRTISIQVVGDTVLEANENFFVNLSNPFNATLADSQGVGNILNDDSLPQLPQPLKHFGYIGAVTDSDLERVREYTDFTFIDGVYNQQMTDELELIKNKYMRALIDLGQVLWCPRTSSVGPDYHLCTSADVDANGDTGKNYIARWEQWKTLNGDFLTSNYVLAFSVITEPAHRNIPIQEVETAVALVKGDYCQIPTLVAEASVAVFKPDYQVASNADWVGVVKYTVRPDLDQTSDSIKNSVARMKSKKQPHQRMAYAIDGFYGPPHCAVAITAADMDTIAQELYTIASRDPEAILLGVFLWTDLPGENAIGSISFPQNVLDKHEAIGKAIKAESAPTYQGAFESITCDSLAGWAWDASQPDTPISVDIYDGTQKIATVRADQFRSGIGNGLHGFTFTLPSSLRNGQTHSITIKYGGLTQQLSGSPRSISCTAPAPVYEGWIDVADCNSFIGWAADRTRPNTPITVSIYDGPNLIGSVVASDLRSDVGAHLGDNGRHGFAIPIPPCFRYGPPHTLRVKFESSTTELSTSPRGIVCETYYQIVARHTSKCLDVAGASTATGANVHQWTCITGLTNQQWQVVPVGGGYFKIVARHSGKVLDVKFGGLDNGTPVWQMDENGTAAQQWEIIPVGDGFVRVVARHSGKVLDVAGAFTADGTQVHQWDYVGGFNQQWLFRAVP